MITYISEAIWSRSGGMIYRAKRTFYDGDYTAERK
jgi:hypothetical protein